MVDAFGDTPYKEILLVDAAATGQSAVPSGPSRGGWCPPHRHLGASVTSNSGRDAGLCTSNSVIGG
jgi:hypothetical protein